MLPAVPNSEREVFANWSGVSSDDSKWCSDVFLARIKAYAVSEKFDIDHDEAEQELPHRVAALQHGLTFLNAALSEYMRKAHLRSDRSSDVENALHRRAGLLWEAFVFKTREVVSWFSLVRGCQGVETALDPDAKRGGLEVLANTALGRARRGRRGRSRA